MGQKLSIFTMPTETSRNNIYFFKREHERLLKDAAAGQAENIRPEDSFIKAGGCYGPYQFINTCVLDSFLVGLHICHNQTPKCRELFQMDATLNAIMIFLDANKYNEAKYIWLIYLNLLNPNCRFKISKTIDFRSEVKDHLPVFINLECSKDYFSEDEAVHGLDDCLYQSIKSAFQHYGDVMLLGMTYKDPSVILVSRDDGLDTAPPLYVTDTYERTFKLQFVLVWKKKVKENHMVVCYNMEYGWVLYDNHPSVLPEEFSNLEDLKNDYPVYLACYVNITQPGHSNVKVPVAEEGSGHSPWNWQPV